MASLRLLELGQVLAAGAWHDTRLPRSGIDDGCAFLIVLGLVLSGMIAMVRRPSTMPHLPAGGPAAAG